MFFSRGRQIFVSFSGGAIPRGRRGFFRVNPFRGSLGIERKLGGGAYVRPQSSNNSNTANKKGAYGGIHIFK